MYFLRNLVYMHLTLPHPHCFWLTHRKKPSSGWCGDCAVCLGSARGPQESGISSCRLEIQVFLKRAFCFTTIEWSRSYSKSYLYGKDFLASWDQSLTKLSTLGPVTSLLSLTMNPIYKLLLLTNGFFKKYKFCSKLIVSDTRYLYWIQDVYSNFVFFW